MTSVDTFLGLTSLGAKPDMEQVNNAIKMDDPYEVVRLFCEANGMGREDFTARFVAPRECAFFISGIPFPEEARNSALEKVKELEEASKAAAGITASHRSSRHGCFLSERMLSDSAQNETN